MLSTHPIHMVVWGNFPFKGEVFPSLLWRLGKWKMILETLHPVTYAGLFQGRRFTICSRPWWRTSPEKRHFFFLPKKKKVSQFPRHGVGVTSYMTVLSDKQVSKNNNNKTGANGGCLNPLTPPPPPPPPSTHLLTSKVWANLDNPIKSYDFQKFWLISCMLPSHVALC